MCQCKTPSRRPHSVRPSPTSLWRLLDLVAREDRHLAGLTGRLFAGLEGDVTPLWLTAVLATTEGIDRLESFVGKFSRMQDTLMDKLLPAFLLAVGERS
jgi:hypothetical protein